jgi:hypothetical protein
MLKITNLLRTRATALAAAGMVAGAIALAASPAHATLEIRLQSGGSTYTQSGSSPLTVTKAIGDFSVTVNTGLASSTPELDLSSSDFNSTGAGTLVVTLSENGLTGLTGLQAWLSQFSGNFSGGPATVTLKTYVDNSNTLLGTGTLLSSFTETTTPFAVSQTKDATTSAPFALTDVLTITTRGASQFSLDGSVTGDAPHVPEPASLAIMASALLGFTVLAHRRRRV